MNLCVSFTYFAGGCDGGELMSLLVAFTDWEEIFEEVGQKAVKFPAVVWNTRNIK